VYGNAVTLWRLSNGPAATALLRLADGARGTGATDWIEQNRQVWTDRFDKLSAHLRKLQQSPSREGQQS